MNRHGVEGAFRIDEVFAHAVDVALAFLSFLFRWFLREVHVPSILCVRLAV